MQTYLTDYAFYAALAEGNSEKMQTALYQLLDTKKFNARRNWENGYTQDLIYTCVIIYAKLAWYHGYQIEVDSPYVPKEWLDMTPLPEYQDEFPFLLQYPCNPTC